MVVIVCSHRLSSLTLWIWTPLRQEELDTTLCDKVCQWLAAGTWFSPVSSTTKTDCQDITEILLKVALNTINLNIRDGMDSGNTCIFWDLFVEKFVILHFEVSKCHFFNNYHPKYRAIAWWWLDTTTAIRMEMLDH